MFRLCLTCLDYLPMPRQPRDSSQTAWHEACQMLLQAEMQSPRWVMPTVHASSLSKPVP